MAAVFCYGTLEFPEIMEVVTGHRLPHTEAVLENYTRFLIKDANYPGVVEATGSRISGTLYTDIDPESLKRLDAYEGSIYVRRTIDVRTADNKTVTAEVYVIPARKRWMLSSKPWNKVEFARTHMKSYLARLHES